MLRKDNKLLYSFNKKQLNELKTTLGHNGYVLYKEQLTQEQINDIKSKLTVEPNICKDFVIGEVPKIPLYLENNKKLYLPRCYGIKQFGNPKHIKLNNGENINIEFVGKLRDNQKAPVNEYLESMKDINTTKGLLSLHTGFGKTALSIYIICQLKKKTLIVVHKKFLENQWIERILQFTNIDKSRIGIIRQNKVQVDDKDIVIGSLQSLTLKDYDTDIFNQFGFVICDEIHSMASNCFSQLFHLVNYRYFLGLSATMKRQDGLHKVYHYFFGDLVYHAQREDDNQVDVHLYEYFDKDPAYSQEYTLTFNGKPNSALMMNNICKFKPRIEKVIRIILNIFEENNERKILLLSSRKEQLSLIYKGIKDKLHESGKTIGFYIGGMKQEQLKESEEKDLILATYAIAKEGLDIFGLSTLILSSPQSEITQAVGRILRQQAHERKFNPLVVDIIDMFSIFKNQGKKRLNFYKQNQYNVIYKERLAPVPVYEPTYEPLNLENYVMRSI